MSTMNQIRAHLRALRGKDGVNPLVLLVEPCDHVLSPLGLGCALCIGLGLSLVHALANLALANRDYGLPYQQQQWEH